MLFVFCIPLLFLCYIVFDFSLYYKLVSLKPQWYCKDCSKYTWFIYYRFNDTLNYDWLCLLSCFQNVYVSWLLPNILFKKFITCFTWNLYTFYKFDYDKFNIQSCKSKLKYFLAHLTAIYDIIIYFNQFCFNFYNNNPKYRIFIPCLCIIYDSYYEFVKYYSHPYNTYTRISILSYINFDMFVNWFIPSRKCWGNFNLLATEHISSPYIIVS